MADVFCAESQGGLHQNLQNQFHVRECPEVLAKGFWRTWRLPHHVITSPKQEKDAYETPQQGSCTILSHK